MPAASVSAERERVRQIEQHALKKLHNEAKKGRLREIV
jgi:DNA-directed RNA polymerase sigma subunit (sigma70/sigma32)